MKQRTQQEVDHEIESLKEIKPKVLHYSAFGDNHHAAIEAQIDVVENQMDEDRVADEFEEEPDNVRDAAIAAAEWLSGERADSLTDEWKELVRP